MDYWLFDLLAVALPTALLLHGRRPPRALVLAALTLSVVALLWTAPWDEHLVRTGVWAYGPDRVLGLVGSVPVEEYAFVVLLVLLVAAWGERLSLLPMPPSSTHRARRGMPSARTAGTAGWLAVGVVGVLLVAVGGQARYLGLLLAWVAPPLALQRAVAGDLLLGRRRARLLLAAPVALWLCVADRLALADGVWAIAPQSSTGVLLLGLPLEEALFFVLTTTLVADGLVLATDARALARARSLAASAVRSGHGRRRQQTVRLAGARRP